jgi:hypothetical protein
VIGFQLKMITHALDYGYGNDQFSLSAFLCLFSIPLDATYRIDDGAALIHAHHLQTLLQLRVSFVLPNVHHFRPLNQYNGYIVNKFHHCAKQQNDQAQKGLTEVKRVKTDRDDTGSSDLSIVLDNGFERRDLILDLQNLLQLLLILDHEDARLAVLSTVQAGFGRVCRVNASS